MKNPIIKLFVLLLLISPTIAQDELPDVAWTIGQDEPIALFESLQFHPDGKSFFVFNKTTHSIEKRSIEDGSILNSKRFQDSTGKDYLKGYQLSPSGNYLITYFDLTIHNKKEQVLLDPNTMEIIKTFEFEPEYPFISYLSYDDSYCIEGSAQASSEFSYNRIFFMAWDFETQEILYEQKIGDTRTGCYSMRISPDNKHIIIERIHFRDYSGTDFYYSLALMNYGTWDIIKSFELEKNVKNMKFSKDGTKLFLVYDEKIDVYSMPSLENLETIIVNNDDFYGNENFQFSSDNNFFLSKSINGKGLARINIFNLEKKENVRQYYVSIKEFELSPNDNKIICVPSKFAGLIMLNAKWTPGVVSVEEQEKTLEFNIIPNPAESNCTVELNLIDAGSLSIRLTGIDGSIVKDFSSKWYNSGNTAIQLDISDIPSGIYFVNMEMNGQSISEKLVVER